jgi:hypothetical protein
VGLIILLILARGSHTFILELDTKSEIDVGGGRKTCSSSLFYSLVISELGVNACVCSVVGTAGAAENSETAANK